MLWTKIRHGHATFSSRAGRPQAGRKLAIMPSARFSIGIDLGTTNCALAFVPLGSEARSQIFGIQQWDTSSTIMESRALPSFLYLPDAVTATQIQPGTASGGVWVVGRLARPGASVLSLLTGRGHRNADPARDGQRRGMGRWPARTQKGRGITRPGRPFSQILALPSYIGSLGALSALGIGGHR